MNKKNAISYVLVADVTDNKLYYYAGYFELIIFGKNIIQIAKCTDDYTKALKIQFNDEAELLCIEVNKNSNSNKFHVEEHMYI